MEISHSLDNNDFQKVGIYNYPQVSKIEDNRINNFIESFDKVETRYIKIKIIGQKKNPSWHPAPGANTWLFLDEITVE